MKTKLLRKLRKKCWIEERNGQYRGGCNFGFLAEYNPLSNTIEGYHISMWGSLSIAKTFVREYVLRRARLLYKKPKKTIKF